MKKEFVTYEQALALKELGFDKKCYGHYDSTGELNTIEEYARVNADILHMLSKKFNSESYMKEMCSAPLKQQVFRWFRENYNLFCEINVDKTMEPKFAYTIKEYESTQFFDGFKEDILSEYLYYVYEEAEIACIDKLIEIVKQK